MKIKIFSFGKPKFEFLIDGIKEYEGRLSKFVSLENVLLKEESISNKNVNVALVEEEKQIFKHFKANITTYLLVENSTPVTTEVFAKKIEHHLLKNGPDIHFFIGSSYGFSDLVKSKITQHLSLSNMTFTHDMARLLLLEQLYRMVTIQKNIPYHH